MGNDLIFEGKKYISASRASKISGYNSDYIGQLCRKGQLDCRRVGRSWFVAEDSLNDHKSEASKTPRGRIPIYEKNQQIDSELSGLLKTYQPKVGHVDKQEHAFLSPYQNPAFFVNKKSNKKLNRKFAKEIALTLAGIILFVLVGSGQVGVSADKIFSLINQEKFVAVENGLDKTIIAFKTLPIEIKEPVANSAAVIQSMSLALSEKIYDGYKGMHRGLLLAFEYFKNTTQKVKLAVADKFGGSVKTRDRDGVVVVPSAQDDSVNEQVKNYVETSFSDEAKIIPDESGNSGVIKPVFKEKNDQEYLYMIVPVKEEAK